MCTILTLDQPAYECIGKAVVQDRVIQDAICNDDGGSLVFIDPQASRTNTVLRSMSMFTLLTVLDDLMNAASAEARFFLHLRAATTSNIGIGYTHAFDDMAGVFYMHNGIITNKKQLEVDSFNLVNIPVEAAVDLWTELFTAGEKFANLFRIDTDNSKYAVVRLSHGTLYTDGSGNYSTNAVSSVNTEVRKNSYYDHLIGVPRPIVTRDTLDDLYLPGHLSSKTNWTTDAAWEKELREEQEWYDEYLKRVNDY